MKKSIFDGFDKSSDEIVDLASRHYHAPQSEKDRVFEMSERRLNEMKKDNDYEVGAHTERKNIEAAPRRFPFAAAACITAVLAGAGAFAIVHNVKPVDVGARSEEIKYLPATADSVQDSAFVLASSSGEAQGKSADTEKKAASEKTQSKTESEKTQSEKGKKAVSSIAETEPQEKLAYPWEISPAIESVPQEADGEDNVLILYEGEEDVSPPYEDEINASANTEGEEDVSTGAEVDSEGEIAEVIYVNERGRTFSNRVTAITPDMTYRQVIDRLGEPETYEQDGYAQYVLDDEKLLMLVYDDENDNIGIGGQDLIDSAYPLNELYANRDEYTFDAFIIKKNEKKDAFFVVCPQYEFFKCAYVYAKSIDEFEYDMIDWLPPYHVRIKHYDAWEESFPVGVDAESIDFYK